MGSTYTSAPAAHSVVPEVAAPPSPPLARSLQGGPQAEITAPQEAPVDFDSELEAVFEPKAPVLGSQTLLMDFDAPNAPPIPPQPLRAAAQPTEIQLDVLDAPPKDEVDDLFMELLDD